MIAAEAKTRMACGGCQREQCRLCHLYATREEYRRHWQGLPPRVPEIGLKPPGDHLASLLATRYEGWNLADRNGSTFITQMNANGPDWCLKNLESLANEILKLPWRLGARNAARPTLHECRGFIREACYMLPHDIMPTLHEQAGDPNALQFVWMFWRPPADGNEIYWSIASVLEHAAPARITVFGSHPGPWYTGEHIPFVSTEDVHRDRINKMKMIARHSKTQREFVWMMDDQYFLKPTAHADIKTPRARGRTAKTRSSWGIIRTRTEKTLRKMGIRTYDYATHLPHYIVKSKLQSIFNRFDFGSPLLWETVYGCIHRRNPEPPEPYFYRITKLKTAERLTRESKQATLLNNSAGTWSSAVIATVQRTFKQERAMIAKYTKRSLESEGDSLGSSDGIVTIDRDHGLDLLTRRRAKKYFTRSGPRRERDVVRALFFTLSNGGVFYDIGSNIGYHSLIVKSLLPKVTVHAFEPCRKTFDEMQSIVDANRLSINCHHHGLSDSVRIAKLHYSTVSDGQHSLHTENAPNKGSENVRVVPLDDLHLPPPTVMKIDVELHELQVLQGARRTIEAHRPTLIIEMRKENENYQKIREFLSDYYARQLDRLNWLFTPR